MNGNIYVFISILNTTQNLSGCIYTKKDGEKNIILLYIYIIHIQIIHKAKQKIGKKMMINLLL